MNFLKISTITLVLLCVLYIPTFKKFNTNINNRTYYEQDFDSNKEELKNDIDGNVSELIDKFELMGTVGEYVVETFDKVLGVTTDFFESFKKQWNDGIQNIQSALENVIDLLQ